MLVVVVVGRWMRLMRLMPSRQPWCVLLVGGPLCVADWLVGFMSYEVEGVDG